MARGAHQVAAPGHLGMGLSLVRSQAAEPNYKFRGLVSVWLAVLIKWLRPGVLGMGLSLVRSQAAEPNRRFRDLVFVWLAVLIKWLRSGVLGMGLSLVRLQAAEPNHRSRGLIICVGCCAHQVAAPGHPGHGPLPGALTGC